MQIYTVINKHLMLCTYPNAKYGNIKPNIFEAVKAECLAHASGILSRFLPYIFIHIPEELPELDKWRETLLQLEGKAIDLVPHFNELDLSKPYNKEIVNKLLKLFPKRSNKKIQIDADTIIQGELGELNENTSAK